MVTAYYGLPSVATDLLEVVKMADMNVRINRQSHGLGDRLALQALEWGTDSPGDATTHYDLILAADCLYATATVHDLDVKLLQTLESLMGPKSILLIAYTVRSGNERLFFSTKLAINGFEFKEVGEGDEDSIREGATHIMEVTRTDVA
jgi:hypothetical protein